MKILLACLMCEILVASECFAISGGPFGGPAHVTVTGKYAGVLVPIPVVPDPSQPDVTLPPDNSLALFTIILPQVGLGTGTDTVFRNGIFYSGTVTGSGDPDSGRLNGILNAVFLEIFSSSSNGSGGTSTTITSEYDANGQFLTTKIVGGSTGATTRIKGRASLTYKNLKSDGSTPDPEGTSGGAILYRVRGFKQSEATS